MKTLYFLICISLISFQSYGQTCCNRPATGEFAMMAGDEKFKSAHDEPLVFDYSPDRGKMITFATPDGKTARAFKVPAIKKGEKFIFVFHEWWGLNDYIKREAERIQKEMPDVTVLAIDLYDGNVAATREKAAEYMGQVVQTRAENIIRGALSYAGENARIGTVGWCFGGGWSLQAALLAGKQSKATVIYYGMPEKDLSRLTGLNSPVLGIFAQKDQWISPAVVKEFNADMKKAGKNLTVVNYDADHAFANPSNPKYDKTLAEDAYARMIGFFKRNL